MDFSTNNILNCQQKRNPRFLIMFIFLIFGSFLFSGCGKQTCSCLTITPPDITLTGPKTSVERQIMGNYREIEKDAWLMSSAKGTGGETISKPGQDSANQKENRIFRAFAIMENHRVKMLDYQKKGIIGENNMGYVAKVSDELDKEESAKIEILTIVRDVNRARKSMYEILLQDFKATRLTLDDIGKKFAQKYRNAAPKGSQVQMDNGKWVTK